MGGEREERRGEREALVFLPGMLCDERLFAPQLRALSGAYEVSVAPLGVLPGDDLAAAAREVAERAAGERFSVAGLSMGGILALAVAEAAPERVRRLALLDTNCRADAPERRPVREAQIASVEAGRLSEVVVEEMKPLYLAEANRNDTELKALLLAMAEAAGAEAFVSQSRALLARPDRSDVLARFAGPVLVLCGEEDALCPPALHREMAAMNGAAELAVVPGAGHISTLEQPEAVTAALRAWMGRPAA